MQHIHTTMQHTTMQHSTIKINGIPLDVLSSSKGLFIGVESLARLLGFEGSRIRRYLNSQQFRKVFEASYNAPTVRVGDIGYQIMPLDYAVAFLMHYAMLYSPIAQEVVAALMREALSLRVKMATHVEDYATSDAINLELEMLQRETEQSLRAATLKDMRNVHTRLHGVCNNRGISSVEVVTHMLEIILGKHAAGDAYDPTYGINPDTDVSVSYIQLFVQACRYFSDSQHDLYRDNWAQVAFTSVCRAEMIVLG